MSPRGLIARDRTRRAFLSLLPAPAFGRIGASETSAAASGSEILSRKLVALYAPAAQRGGERYGRPSAVVIEGRLVSRDEAYRDDPNFARACDELMRSTVMDEARLGAWLLGTARAHSSASSVSESTALGIVRSRLAGAPSRDRLVRFQLAKSALDLGDAAGVIRATRGATDPEQAGLRALALGGSSAAPRRASSGPARRPLERGVCFWFEGHEADFGAAQFAKLKRFGATRVSLHTWEPRQQGKNDPELRQIQGRFGLDDLRPWVRNASRAGLRVTFKPHLEMGFRRVTASERRVLDLGTDAEKRDLRSRLDRERAQRGWHGEIEMTSEADWRTWFEGFASFTLRHAERAATAGADTFCLGREIDRTAIQRESDWRDLIQRVRAAFPGKLTYSAHHDTFEKIPFWDALDMIGVAAYPPVRLGAVTVAGGPQPGVPSPRDVRATWEEFASRCDALAERMKKPLTFSEVGYPAVGTAAREPWREGTTDAEPLLQSDLLSAALTAARQSDLISGTDVWLWEGVSRPPFRDRSFTVQDKPAAFAMASVYRRE
jgi:hypothetical protein